MRTPTKQTQDWQIEAYEMQSKHNRFIRHQRVMEEMNNQPTRWGVNMSERKK